MNYIVNELLKIAPKSDDMQEVKSITRKGGFCNYTSFISPCNKKDVTMFLLAHEPEKEMQELNGDNVTYYYTDNNQHVYAEYEGKYYFITL